MTDRDADADADPITMLLESFALLLCFAELLAFTLLAFELLRLTLLTLELLAFTLRAFELVGRTLVFRLELSFLDDDTAPSHFPNALLQPVPQYAFELPHPKIVLRMANF
jgi:hypothetical protein